MKSHLILCVILSSASFFTNVLCSTYVHLQPKFDDESLGLVHLTLKHPLTLACNVTSDESVEVKWRKGNDSIEKISALNNRYKFDRSGQIHTLSIWQTGEDDAGNYSCVAIRKGEEVDFAKMTVISNIHLKLPDNVNVVEGEKLRLHCIVHGKPVPKLHWHYENSSDYQKDFYESEGRIILEMDTEKNISNAILRMEAVELYDRGKFTCIAVSDIDERRFNATCMVRIKDRYAALWPFLGICLEVLVLCTIIFIYEKKRNKQEAEDSDTDQGNDQKNTPDHGKDSNLRHRQQ